MFAQFLELNITSVPYVTNGDTVDLEWKVFNLPWKIFQHMGDN